MRPVLPTCPISRRSRRQFFALLLVFALYPGTTNALPIIQEVFYDQSGLDGNAIFTELVGSPGMDLTGFSLVGINGADANAYNTVDLTGAVIPSDGVLVITTGAAVGATLAARDFIADVDWQNGADAIQLRDSGQVVIDALQYGDAGANNAGEGAPALDVSAGQSLSRDVFATDTNDNLMDFTVLTAPTPGFVSFVDVVIQEVLYDDSGLDGEDIFTELLGPPGMDLTGFTLIGVNGVDGSVYNTVDLIGAVIPSDGLLVIAGGAAQGATLAARDVIANVDWQNGADAIQLLDPSQVVLDALQYGDAGVNNAGEGVPAFDVSAGGSLSRDRAGTDTDDNLTDFSSLSVPTPGFLSLDDVVIQEVFYDESGPDGESIFTELGGPPGAFLTGFNLVGINGANGDVYQTVDLTGAVIPGDGLLVIAGPGAQGPTLTARDFIADVDWQNGVDAVQLLGPGQVVIDALQYGDAGANNAGEGAPASDVSAGQSLTRDVLGTDTNDNLADFTPLLNGSPGTGFSFVPRTGPLAPPPAADISTAPEPGTLALIVVGMLCWAGRSGTGRSRTVGLYDSIPCKA